MTSFKVNRSVLAVLADRAGSVVPSSAAYQSSVQNLRIQVAGTPPGLRLTGTDMEVTVVTSTPAVQVLDGGEILVEARRFLDLVRAAVGDDVAVSTQKDPKGRLSARVVSGGASWDLRLKDETYPEIPAFPDDAWRAVSREHLVSSIKTVRHAASRNGSYPAWACVAILPDLEKDTGTKHPTLVMASDMARSQFAQIPHVAADGKAVPGFPFACSIPAAGGAVAEVLKVLSAVDLPSAEVAETEAALGFRVGSTTIMVVKMHTRPANIKRSLERATTRNTLSLAVKRDELAGAVRRVRVNADPTTPVIGLRAAPGKLTVLSQDKFGNHAEQVVGAAWDSGEMLMLVNASFLTDMLAVHPSDNCEFLVAPTSKDKRKSEIMLRDEVSGVTGIIPQMASEAARLGYE